MSAPILGLVLAMDGRVVITNRNHTILQVHGTDRMGVVHSMNRQVILLILLCIALFGTDMATAMQPCATFEGGLVAPAQLQVMRDAAAEGRLFQVVPGTSSAEFSVRYLFGMEFHGEMTDIAGCLTMPRSPRLHGQALLLIKANSMTANHPELLPMVQGTQFLDARNYPQMLFAGHLYQPSQPLVWHISGDLTLHGRTRPVLFNINIEVLESRLGDFPVRILLTGDSQVDRRQFNITSHHLLVSDKVDLHLSAELVAWGH